MEQNQTDPSDLKPEELIWWYQNRAMLKEELRERIIDELDKRGIMRESIPAMEANAPARPLPMTWFNVWWWVGLPSFALNALLNISWVANESTVGPNMGYLGIIITVVIAMYLLEKRHIYGWWLNWLFIFAIVFAGSNTSFVDENDVPIELDYTTGVMIKLGYLLLFLLGWLWPNIIYFKKRRYIFTEQIVQNNSPSADVPAPPESEQ